MNTMPSVNIEIAFHPSMFPEPWRAGMIESLRHHLVPGSFLYHSPAQAGRWLAYHQAYSPSRRDAALQNYYRDAFTMALRQAVGDETREAGLRLVSLGCGGGTKDAEFLACCADFMQTGKGGHLPLNRVHYLPLDASATLLVEALHRVRERFAGTAAGMPKAAPLVADIAREPDLGEWITSNTNGTTHIPTVFTCFGLLPNLAAADFCNYLARWLDPPHLLVISANLSPRGMNADRNWILPQYDNPQARRWYFGALGELGFPMETVSVNVTTRVLDDDQEVWRIVVEAELLSDFTLPIYDTEISYGAGQIIEAFSSSRYTVSAMEGVLHKAGLEISGRWLMDSGEEGIWICRRVQHSGAAQS